MGLEPTTFCKANGSWVEPTAALTRMVEALHSTIVFH
jgi:hypothetical protein